MRVKAVSKLSQAILVGVGTLVLGLGIVGIFVPLLPTVPFVLLAAACYARSSPRFHNALRNGRTFGPMIRDWEEHRSVSRKTKRMASVLIVLSFGATVALFIDDPYLRMALIALAFALLAMVVRLPTREVRRAAEESSL